MSRCQRELKAEGLPYPRTCEECGLGPCKRYVRQHPDAPVPPPIKTGVQLIAEERARQISQEGWTAEHDEKHRASDLALAAACYAIPAPARAQPMAHYGEHRDGRWGGKMSQLLNLLWPWEARWWKPAPNDRVRELVKAGALIAAEIDRLQRAAAKKT